MTEPLLRTYFHLAKSFLMIGLMSFGGYLPLVAMVRDKLVVRDRLLDDSKITEGLALSSLLPGPLAVNVVAYIGYSMGGISGAAVSIASVLIPSFLLVLGASYLYFEFGSLINADLIMAGIFPVILAIIFVMAFNTFQRDCTRWSGRIIFFITLLLLLFVPGYWTIVAVIVLSGSAGLFLYKRVEAAKLNDNAVKGTASVLVPAFLMVGVIFLFRSIGINSIILELFNQFAGASLTLFGGGYVMIPVLKSLLVENLGWVNEKEFVLGISIGQVTPGPILISTAFFGYKVGGVVGALAAACGIFIPSSLLMIFCSHFYERISHNERLKAALTGIKPAIVGLILYSGVSLLISDRLFDNRLYLALLTAVGIVLLEGFKWSTLRLALAGFVGGIVFLFIHNL